MANRYCNLVGTNKIKDEYTKINDGFDAVEQEMDAAMAAAQAAQNTANAALPKSGGEMTGTLIFANNTPIRLKETDGTTRNALFMSGVNDIMVGSTANPLIFSASSIPKYYDGSIAHDIWSAANAGPFYRGSGSPEGVVTAPVGAIYQRTDGGASSTLYVKESGSGNTGWKAVQTA